VKHISIAVAPTEFRRLKAGKGARSWREAIVEEVAVPRGEADG
jgi:hypothetical protein